LAVILLGSRIVVSISKSYEHVPNDVRGWFGGLNWHDVG
jgi:hypothetical protein